MNKFIKMLALLALVSASVSADSNNCNPCSTPCSSPCGDQYNKTHMTPRSHGVNLALEYTDGWRDLLGRKAKDSFGGNFQLGFFYEASTEGYQTGRYFSPNITKSNGNSNTPCPSTCTPCGDAPACNLFTWGTHLGSEIDDIDRFAVDTDLNLRCFVHLPLESILTQIDGADQGANFSTVLNRQYTNASQALKMDRRTYGFMLNYHQDLSCLYKGLYFKVNLPIAHVENRIKCCLETSDWTIAGENTEDGTNPVSFSIAGNDIKTMIQDFLDGDKVTVPLKKWTVTDNGSTEELADVVLQERLCGCTIPCGCETSCETVCPSTCNPCDTPKSNKRHKSKTGIADIDVQIGYNLLNKAAYHHTIAFGFTIPTGSGPGTHRIWDAQVGYNDHWGVGFSCNGDVRLWNDENQNLVLFHALNYRYLFSDCETRCLGICGENWGHFELLGKVGQATLIPAANVLTTKVDVTLGSQIDYIIGLNYVNSGFSIDLGYNLFYRDAEDIDLKNCACLFTPETYALPAKEFLGVAINNVAGTQILAGNVFAAADRKNGADGKWLSNADIDKSVAETPRQLSHKIFAGVSYATKSWDIPFLVGVGGHYEFGDENSTRSTWGIHLK